MRDDRERLRDIIIDLPLVWNMVERELPELKKQVTAILNELGGS
jgi:uncharacterized protein with HEPN domain